MGGELDGGRNWTMLRDEDARDFRVAECHIPVKDEIDCGLNERTAIRWWLGTPGWIGKGRELILGTNR